MDNMNGNETMTALAENIGYNLVVLTQADWQAIRAVMDKHPAALAELKALGATVTDLNLKPQGYTHTNDMANIPAAACKRCGGWTGFGGMSKHRNATTPVLGRTGCTCEGA